MEIRKNQFLLDRLSHNVLDEPLNAGNVFEHVFIGRANFRFDQDSGEEPIADRQRILLNSTCWCGVPRKRSGTERTIVIEVIEDAKVNPLSGSFICHDDFTTEYETGDCEAHGE